MKQLFATLTLSNEARWFPHSETVMAVRGRMLPTFEGCEQHRISFKAESNLKKKEKLSLERNPFPKNLKSLDGLS
jgi:hypothetical protein